MSLLPIITNTQVINRYGNLLVQNNISVDAVTDTVAGVIGLIQQVLGYNPEIDSNTNLATVTEKLDGGRPLIFLKAAIDLNSAGSAIAVSEFGTPLVQRPDYQAPPAPLPTTGQYLIDESGYGLIRLVSTAAIQQGIWGASSLTNQQTGFNGYGLLSSFRLDGNYKQTFRQCVTVTYNPLLRAGLLSRIALALAGLDLLMISPQNSWKDADQSITNNMNFADLDARRESILQELPRPIYIGAGE